MSTSPHLSPAKDPSGSWREATSGVELEGGGGGRGRRKKGSEKEKKKKVSKKSKRKFQRTKKLLTVHHRVGVNQVHPVDQRRDLHGRQRVK